MGAAATLKSSTGKEESTGLNVLDVVKHAIKTIIAALDANDRLAVVAFNDRVHLHCLPISLFQFIRDL